MNKKGIMGFGYNFVFGTIGIFVLIMVLTVMIGVQDGNTDYNESVSTLKGLQDKFSKQFEPDNLKAEDHDSELMFSVMKIMYSLIDFVLYVTMEVCLAALDFSMENTDWINAKLLIFIVMASLLAPILITLLKVIVILFILTKEYYQSRREKRELKRLEIKQVTKRFQNKNYPNDSKDGK